MITGDRLTGATATFTISQDGKITKPAIRRLILTSGPTPVAVPSVS